MVKYSHSEDMALPKKKPKSVEMTSTRAVQPPKVAAAPPPMKGSCCTPCCTCCACCVKPMLMAAFQLMEPEIDAIVERKLAAMAPGNAKMVRSGTSTIPTPPSMADYHKWLSKHVPNAPPLEAFETWQRNKGAITVQRLYRGRAAKMSVAVRAMVEKLPEADKAAAISKGLDGLAEIFKEQLGKNVWARAIFNAPNAWSEAQMTDAIADVLRNPRDSPHLHLLTKPTKHERVLLGLSRTVAIKHESAREVKAARKIQKIFRGRSKRLGVMVRFQIDGLPKEARARAAGLGLDAMSDLIAEHLGKNVWARAVHNAPDSWEEEQMVFAIREVLASPTTTGYLWLLAKPTKHERMLLTAFSRGDKAFTGSI